MNTNSPASRALATMARVDILPSPDDVPTVGTGDGVIVGDAVDDASGVRLGEALGVAIFVGVALGGRVFVGVGVGVTLGEGVGVGVSVEGSVAAGSVGRVVAVAEGGKAVSDVGVASPSPT